MRLRDIYDDMPNGDDQRRHNQQRLAELAQEGAARRERLATVIVQSELDRLIVAPLSAHPH